MFRLIRLALIVTILVAVGALAVFVVKAKQSGEAQSDYGQGLLEGRSSYYPQKSHEAAASLCERADKNGSQRRSAAYARGCVDGAIAKGLTPLGPEGGYPY